MQKKKSAMKIFLVVTIVGISFFNVFGENLGKAGSNSDPLVTKSYVDKKINEILGVISNFSNDKNQSSNFEVSYQDKEELKKIVEEIIGNSGATTSEKDSQTFKPVEVKKGKTLLGGEGTEIIMRSGSAIIYSKVSDGVVDTTLGSDLLNGMQITKNHLLIVPREDGRGAVSHTDSWFMVRGKYNIK